MGGRTIWCLGMYASASTWLFNVVRQIYAGASPETDVRSHFFSGAADVAKFGQDLSVDLVKSHEITDPATVLALARRAEKIFVTMRDPRDAVTSLMLYHKLDFERALGLAEQAASLCADFARDRRALFYRYEDGFFDDPETVIRIATHLGIQLTDDQARPIFAGLNRQAVERHIAKMPKLPGMLLDRKSGDQLDPQTHWHTHHAGRDGELGRWKRVLTPAQALQVATAIGDRYEFG